MRRSRLAMALVLSLVLIAAAFEVREDARRRELERTLPQGGVKDVPIVFLLFDELPLASLLDDRMRIDAELFPNFARLAEDSFWFRNTATVATFTGEALPAILTGSYPDIPASSDAMYPHNLFTVLGDEYEVVAHEDLPRLCTPRFCDEPTKAPVVPETAHLKAFAEGERGQHLNAFMRNLERPQRPTLYFLHMILPHGGGDSSARVRAITPRKRCPARSIHPTGAGSGPRIRGWLPRGINATFCSCS